MVGICVLWLGGCSGAPTTIDPAVVEAEEARLRAPFGESRTIVCERLDVSLSPNFVGVMTYPVPNLAVQSEERLELPDGGLRRTFKNGGGDSLRFAVGNLAFRVLEEARIEVLGGRATMTLSAETSGDTWLVQGSQTQQISPLRIADGAARP